MATRWAICGTGKIAHDFCACLRGLPSSEHQIVAVAARSSKEKAEEFSKQFDIPHSYGSYDELLKNDFDVVYVNCINPYHVENSLKFINAGKAVLCEKPMAMTLEGCQKVLNAAKEKGVLFVEGTWSRFFPAYSFIKEKIEAGSIGDIKTMQASFCVPVSEVPRVTNKDLGGGGLMDIGIYVVQASNFVFREKPQTIWSDGTMCSKNGVDKSGIIVLGYSDGRFSTLNYHTETQGDHNSMIIRGTKGTIEIPDCFWCPDKLKINGEVKEFPLPILKDKFNFGNSEGLTYEAQEVRRCLVNGLKETPFYPHADSESIMTVLQQVLDNFGIKFDAL